MPAKRESDEWLMRQVAAGNREDLETLVRRYANVLLTFIQRMTGCQARSEELFQEVFLRVWKKRLLYKYPRPFRAWLYQIAANCCRTEYRGGRNRQTVSLDAVLMDGAPHPAAHEPLPADVAVANETAVHVLAAVEQLPQQQRTVAVLRIWNDMSFGQIAEITGRTESTARATMHHALANMRKYLEPRLK